MIRRDDFFLLTQVENIADFKYDDMKAFIDIKVDYCYCSVDFNEKVVLPKCVVVLLENKLDVMIIEKLESLDMESMRLVCVSDFYIELNEAGKDYYNILCMIMSNNETDDNWVDINKFVDKYCIDALLISY